MNRMPTNLALIFLSQEISQVLSEALSQTTEWLQKLTECNINGEPQRQALAQSQRNAETKTERDYWKQPGASCKQGRDKTHSPRQT